MSSAGETSRGSGAEEARAAARARSSGVRRVLSSFRPEKILPPCVCLLSGFLVWLIFRPGILNVDGLVAMIDQVLNEDPCIRFVNGRHLMWLGTNLILVGGAAALYARGRKRRAAVLGAVLLLPLIYYGSYALASANFDYRYMYPAILFVQIVTLTLLAAEMRLGIQALSRIIPD